MSDKDNTTPPIVLDQFRGMAAQKETDQRRHSSEVIADQLALRHGQGEIEKFLFAAPAATWLEAAAKAEHLLKLFAATPEAQDPRCKQMIENVLNDFRKLAT